MHKILMTQNFSFILDNPPKYFPSLSTGTTIGSVSCDIYTSFTKICIPFLKPKLQPKRRKM